MCVFARQNVLADPPFSRMDLVACRNVLIYLEPVLQKRLIPLLHYALRNHGFLWLGTSETIGAYRELFEPLDAKYKLYGKKPGATRPRIVFERLHLGAAAVPTRALPHRDATIAEHNREADRILLARYSPPAVVLTRDLEILQYRGDTGPYLAPAAGKASLNLLKMLRQGLAPAVSRAVEEAARKHAPVREDGLRVRANGGYREVAIEVVPIRNSSGEETLLLLFHDQHAHPAHANAKPNPPDAPLAESDAQQEVERLRNELTSTRDYLQSVIEQQDAFNEELQSANEEVQSANEELQSTNEELETSKEEIQSGAEELETINDELHSRNLELARAHNDLLNLLASAHLPIVIVGRDLLIRRLTPAAEKSLNLIPSDVGRPLSDIKLSVEIPDLNALLRDVIDTMKTHEREVQDNHGRWVLVRIRPYKTFENTIDGAVLILIDIDSAMRAASALRESEARFAALANSAPVLIWVSGAEGLEYANRTATEFFGVDEDEVKRYTWERFIHPDDRAAYLRNYRERYVAHEPFETQIRLRRADGSYRWMKSVALPRFADGDFLGYVASCVDIEDLKHAEEALREADCLKNRFIAVLGHELRNPLAAVRNAVEAISLSRRDGSVLPRALDVIERQTANMVRIVDDLLDISRITHGKLVLHKSRVDVVAIVRQAIAATEHMRNAAGQSLRVDLPAQPIWVDGDAVRLEQIFGNLLVNSSKFTNAGGNIQVVASAGAGAGPGGSTFASIRIVDDGIGMNPAFIDKIFELFVQGERPPSSRATGMGLGLPLTKQLVELHGGTIHATSEGEGKGLEIEVCLPLLEV
jgi:two-component system CheB/CheR fusion protein